MIINIFAENFFEIHKVLLEIMLWNLFYKIRELINEILMIILLLIIFILYKQKIFLYIKHIEIQATIYQ